MTEQDKIVLEMKHARDMIQQSQKKIELNLEKERQLVKTLIQDGMKEKALQHIKKMREHKQKLVRLDGELEKLEKKIFELDFYKIQADIEDTLRNVNENLQRSDEILGEDRDGSADVTKHYKTALLLVGGILGACAVAVVMMVSQSSS